RPPHILTFIQRTRDVATCMYYTGIDPFMKEQVYVARNLRDRKMQRALLQFFKPENYFEVRKALEAAGRADLIGNGCAARTPAHPPKEALRARRDEAIEAVRGDFVHSIPKRGYRPGRSTARRQGRSRNI